MIIIGSRAMLIDSFDNDSNIRFEKSDYDVIMTREQFNKWIDNANDNIISIYPTNKNKYSAKISFNGNKVKYEIEIATDNSSAKLLIDNIDRVTVSNRFIGGIFGELYRILSKEYLLLTKRSHIIYPVHFEKTINDYNFLKKECGTFEHDEYMKKYYELRSNEAKERYSKYKTPKLNVTTEDFFSSKLNVPNYFVHDDIHHIMAHYDKPVFTMMQKDSSKAWCEKDMFFDLPYEYQVRCVQEEAYVIALERYIIPQYGDDWMDFFKCYKKAVQRICTTLCSGWFREFAIENYENVIDWYNPLFVDKFYNAFDKEKILPIVDSKKVPIPQKKV